MISEFRWPAIYTAFLQRVDIVNIDLPSLVGITCLVEFDYRYSVLTSLAIPIVLVGGSLGPSSLLQSSCRSFQLYSDI